jgi:DNA polymerase-3 subunit gamma/tau
LNCAGGPKPDFSLDDPVCLAIEQGNCLDVVEIDAASNRSIEDAKKIRDECQSDHLPFKVFIIDEVHQLDEGRLQRAAQDARGAAALGEVHPRRPRPTKSCRPSPPAASASSSIDLRGRHRRPAGPASSRLTASPPTQHALTAIARLAAGGMDSQSILDQVISFSGKQITEADVLSIYGLASAQQVTDLCQGIATGDWEEGPRAVRRLPRRRARPARARRPPGPRARRDARFRPLGRHLPQLGAPLATEQLVRLLECLQEGENGIRQGLSPRANFEVTLLKAIEQSRSRSIDLLIKDIAAAAAGLLGSPAKKNKDRAGGT